MAAAVAAPLIGGGVHRATLTLLLVAVTTGFLLFSIGLRAEGREMRFPRSAFLLLPFVLVPILQSIPIPFGLRARVDPRGTSLLQDLTVGKTTWPLSLDPPVTRAEIGKAAMAIAVFIVAFHLASGQRRRQLLQRLVGITGVAAVVIGIGHKLAGVTHIYGLLQSTHRTLLIGPFVNANHTAELLELGAFACLACSFHRPTMLNKAGWLIGMFLCVGGTAATLSRGGIGALALGVLVFVVLRFLAADGGRSDRHRALGSGVALLGILVVAAIALGAGPLVERFHSGTVTSDIRFQVWRDSLRVFSTHPFGIGRGAFDRVFPIYRTVRTPFPLRFAFVENEPLQFLIDCGWLFAAVVFVTFGMVLWMVGRSRRWDRVQSALVAGLCAVLAHNLVDFGLETPGVLLPFMGILATVMARGDGSGRAPGVPAWGRWGAIGAVVLSGVLGIAFVRSSSYDNFDALLKKARSPDQTRAVLARARATHPLDYFYVLASAALAPVRATPGSPSPRFHLLNQALVLCPACEAVHLAVAQNLWGLGLRQQALMEYRTFAELEPRSFRQVLGELFGKGAKPAELASVAGLDPGRMLEIARFLSSTGRNADAVVVLRQAEAIGAPKQEVLVSRATLQLALGQVADAQESVAALHTLGAADARVALLDARVTLVNGDPQGPERALALLDAATQKFPNDVDLEKMRVDVVVSAHKWGAVTRALEGYKQALYLHSGVATDAHIASGRAFSELGRWTDAIGEYRIALADQPTNVALWMELGQASETAGRIATAREAYSAAVRLSPNNPEPTAALRRLDRKRNDLSDRGMGISP